MTKNNWFVVKPVARIDQLFETKGIKRAKITWLYQPQELEVPESMLEDFYMDEDNDYLLSDHHDAIDLATITGVVDVDQLGVQLMYHHADKWIGYIQQNEDRLPFRADELRTFADCLALSDLPQRQVKTAFWGMMQGLFSILMTKNKTFFFVKTNFCNSCRTWVTVPILNVKFWKKKNMIFHTTWSRRVLLHVIFAA